MDIILNRDANIALSKNKRMIGGNEYRYCREYNIALSNIGRTGTEVGRQIDVVPSITSQLMCWTCILFFTTAPQQNNNLSSMPELWLISTEMLVFYSEHFSQMDQSYVMITVNGEPIFLWASKKEWWPEFWHTHKMHLNSNNGSPCQRMRLL